MAKNITIWQGGADRNYNGVKKIKAPKSDGTPGYWLPEDETTRGTLNVTANGTYKASDNNVYGFSQVNVNIQQATSITGWDSTDGTEHNITTDPTTQEIVNTRVPSIIEVNTPPNTIVYANGATISYTGMVVKAYDGEGNLWTDANHPNGIIPINELTLPVTTASFADGYTVTADDDISPYTNPFKYSKGTEVTQGAYTYRTNKEVYITSFYDKNTEWGLFVMASKTLAKYETYHGSFKAGEAVNFGAVSLHGESFYVYGSSLQAKTLAPAYNPQNLNGQAIVAAQIGYAMLFGTPTGGSVQSLPIKWARPGDGYVLDTSQLITKA